jgi:hypothetical protein
MDTDFAREKNFHFTGYAQRKWAYVENLCIRAARFFTNEPCYQY